MKRAFADKIASVAQSCGLAPEIRLSPDIPAEEGVVVAVEILNDKATYNQLELASGRMARVKQGDVVVGALGHRKALFGYSGSVPAEVNPGDTLQLLNLGGVIGRCESADLERGAPFDCRVLGTVLEFPFLGERIGVPARVGTDELPQDVKLDTKGIPVVAIAGTCMDSGKTAAACAIISRLRRQGLVVDAFKATGVSARRDILAMEDAGARETRIFTDLGIVTTTATNGPDLTKSMLNELAEGKPDVIVFELGDGILGAYGVETILADESIGAALTAVVLSANDPVAAWGGVTLLRERFGIEPAVVTGPATDNAVGIEIIKTQLALDAANARTSGAALGDIVLEHCHERTH
jgi:hypothetical protein